MSENEEIKDSVNIYDNKENCNLNSQCKNDFYYFNDINKNPLLSKNELPIKIK